MEEQTLIFFATERMARAAVEGGGWGGMLSRTYVMKGERAEQKRVKKTVEIDTKIMENVAVQDGSVRLVRREHVCT